MRARRKFYFAYGSNMSSRRVIDREVEFSSSRRAILLGYSLSFTKPTKTGSAAADIQEEPGSMVEGVVFEMTEEGLKKLDVFEGVAKNQYARVNVRVYVSDLGRYVRAVVYKAIPYQAGIKPTIIYMSFIIKGAREHGLSPEYIEKLEAVECQETK